MQQWDAGPAPRAGGTDVPPGLFVLPQLPVGQALRHSGDTKALSESWVLANPVVDTCRRVSEPYKKANRKFHPDDTVVEVGGKVKIGGGSFAVMAGVCE